MSVPPVSVASPSSSLTAVVRGSGCAAAAVAPLVRCGFSLKPRPSFLNLELVELLPSLPFSLELFLEELLADLVRLLRGGFLT
jgi:hypothetical protein